MGNWKRWLACFLSLTLLIVSLPLNGLSVLAVERFDGEMTADEWYYVDITEPGETVTMTFTPKVSGRYMYAALTAEENHWESPSTTGNIFDADGNYVVDVLHGLNNDFRVYADLTAGETYTMKTQYTDSYATGTYRLIVSLIPFVDIAFEDIVITENTYVGTGNYWDDNGDYVGEWNFYNHKCAAKYKLTMRDGSTLYQEGEGFYINDVYYHLEILEDTQSYDVKWEAGNTYSAKVGMVGTTLVGEYDVTIEKFPIESIHVDDVTLYEGVNSHMTTDGLWDEDGQYIGESEPYFAYDIAMPNYVITMTDGTVYQNDSIYVGDEYFSMPWYIYAEDTDQSYDNQWKPGNTYQVKGELGGVEYTFDVTIGESPIASIDVEKVQLIENGSGYWQDEWNGEEWVSFFAYSFEPQHYTITLKDGTVYKDTGFDFNQHWQDLEWVNWENTNQSYDNPWTVGNTYTVTGKLAGFEYSYEVEIIDSPIASIHVETVELVEGLHGWINHDSFYNEETEEWEDVSFRVYSFAPQHYTITLKDGTVYEDEGFDFGGYYYPVEFKQWYQTGQSYTNQWTVGNTYTVNDTLAGFDFSYNVSIIEIPIASLEVKKVQLLEGYYGYYRTDSLFDEYGEWIGETDEYFAYHVTPREYTITLKDGTVYENEGFFFDGMWIGPTSFEARETEQSFDNQWTVGNTYTINDCVAGFEFSYEVEVIDTPIESVVVDKVVLLPFTDSYTVTDSLYNEDGDYLGESDPYSVYDIYPQDYVITMKDGTVYEDEGFFFAGEWFGLDHLDAWSTNQSYENQWQPGNTYTVTGKIAGFEYAIEVEVLDTPIQSVEVEKIQLIEGVDSHLRTDALFDENDNYIGDSNPYRAYSYNIRNYTITLKDGSVYTNQGFYYADRWFNIPTAFESWETDQSYDNQWTVGNTYTMTASVAGFKFSYEVEIAPLPIKSIEVKKIQLVENFNGYYVTDSLWSDNGDYLGETEPYYVYGYQPEEFTVTMTDGTVYENEGFYIGNEWFDMWWVVPGESGQTFDNQWEVGNTYTVKATLAGFEYSYQVEIVESPVASVEVEKVYLIEGVNGSFYQDDLYDEYGEWIGMSPEYFAYEFRPQRYTITLKDGTVYEDRGFYIGNEWVNIFWMDAYETAQSYDNQWTVGNTYVVEKTLCGVPYSYEVEIVDSIIESIDVSPIFMDAETNGYWMTESIYDEDGSYVGPGETFYVYEPSIQDYTIVLKDGRVYKNEGFDFDGAWYNVWGIHYDETNQTAQTPWTEGNTYTITRELLGFEYEIQVTIQKPTFNDEYDYEIVEDGVVIMDTFIEEETIVIPEEIDGMKVVGVISLGSSWCIRQVVIPDGVKMVGKELFNFLPNLENVTIGSDVYNLQSSMFENCYEMVSYTVADDNPYFCTVDGVLYNKGMDTLIAYPIRKGRNYTVPKTVTNIDALDAPIYGNLQLSFEEGHSAFVTVNGVTYNKDMTKILYVDKTKVEGVYVMPETVTEIPGKAFEDCDLLTEVVVSPKVTEIVYYAFASCDNLQAVQLPAGLVSIGERVFYETNSLTEIKLPDTLIEIGSSAFMNSGVPSIKLPDSMQIVEYNAFMNSGLVELDLGNGLKEIGSSAFSKTGITAVTIPDSLVAMGNNAFADCYNLKTLTIGSGLNGISNYAFINTAITELVLPSNVQYVGNHAFQNSDLEKVTFENPAVEIGDYAFMNTNLKSLKLGDQLQRIGEYAFSGTDITEIDIPDSVTRIVYGAFADCEALADIRIPENALYIGGHTFDNTAWYNEQGEGVVYLDHVAYSWKGDMPEQHKMGLQEGTTAIADYAFEDQRELRAIELPSTLTVIGEYAFYGCKSLREIYIPESVKSIGYGAFVGCGQLQITVDENNPYYEVRNGVLYRKGSSWVVWDPADEVMTSVMVDRYPNKMNYRVGEEFDPSGMVLIAYYRSGYREFLTEGFEVIGFENSQAGRYGLSFSYNGFTTESWQRVWVSVSDYVPVTGVSFSYDTVMIDEGEVATVVATVFPYDATNRELVWESSDPTIVAVEPGVVIGLKPGKAIITVTTVDGKFQATCEVTVVCAHAHTTEIPAEPSTCLQHGHGAYVVCDGCGEVIEGSDELLPFADHTGGTATCERLAICDVCRKPYGDYAQHQLKEFDASPASHHHEGNKHYWFCQECKTYFADAAATDKITYEDTIIPIIPHDFGEKWYSNADQHWKQCTCGDTQDIAPHDYDSVCDATCNVCGETREAPHAYAGDCDTVCNLCNATRVAKADHTFATDCDVDCDVCKAIRVAPHKYAGACDSTCDDCGATRVTTTSHTFSTPCSTHCTVCGETRDNPPHITSGDCDTTCNFCGAQLKPTAGHMYSHPCDAECDVCGELRNVKHNYSSEWDATCDICGDVRQITYTGWLEENGKWYYYQNGGMLKNQWKADSMGWCYLGSDGAMKTNAWIKDSVGWCYVSGNGYIVKNGWISSGGKWYYLNADGYMLYNTWQRDSNGWCYLGHDGAMKTNAWIKDSQGWCYVGANGYCVTNKWMKDSVGWVYLNGEGRMVVNSWVKDSVGWCYVGNDGYAVTNCWKKDSVGWCYLNSEGSMKKNEWLYDGGAWYYLDANGYMVTGTRTIGGIRYTFNASGVLIA